MIKKVYFLILILFILFLIAEIFSRLFFKGLDLDIIPEAKKLDPYSGNIYTKEFRPYLHSHIPKSNYIQSRSNYAVKYKINSLGFRGDEIPELKNKLRIIIIGDSLIEGHGSEIENTIPFILNKEFSDTKYEFINLGVQGASPIYYASNLDRYLQFNPDIILLALYNNDILEDRMKENNLEKLPFLDNPNFFFYNKNLFFNLKIVNMLYVAFQKLNQNNESIYKITKENKKLLYKELEKYPEQFELLKNMQGRFIPEIYHFLFSLSSKYLDYIHSETKKRNIPIIIMNLSFLDLTTKDKNHPHYNNQKFIELTKEWSLKNNIPFFSIDSYILNEKLKNPNRIFHIIDDGHPTSQSNYEFALEIKKFLLNILN